MDGERLIDHLHTVIRYSVKALAILMVLVIVMGVIDVGWTIYQKVIAPPSYIMTIQDLLASFGAFMTVLIAIEIFENITIYLKEGIIHVKIVMATAMMAVARKIIIIDPKNMDAQKIWSLALLMAAVAIGYAIVMRLPRFDLAAGADCFKEESTAKVKES